jgi:hypothetical protein
LTCKSWTPLEQSRTRAMCSSKVSFVFPGPLDSVFVLTSHQVKSSKLLAQYQMSKRFVTTLLSV